MEVKGLRAFVGGAPSPVPRLRLYGEDPIA